MQLTDVEGWAQKRLATGAFTSAGDVIRRALETLDAEESWTDQERSALDEKIDWALEQVSAGRVYRPEEARQALAELRETHLAHRSRQSWTRFQLSDDAIFDTDTPNSGHRRADLTGVPF
jgi:Arc/MetJ-type ribon-helix-helix transcriptional regulator